MDKSGVVLHLIIKKYRKNKNLYFLFHVAPSYNIVANHTPILPQDLSQNPKNAQTQATLSTILLEYTPHTPSAVPMVPNGTIEQPARSQ